MSDNTFVTADGQTMTVACEAMRDGKRLDWEIGSEPIRGEVVKIERRDDGDFNITVRE